MDTLQQDCFVVFVRENGQSSERAERELVSCSSYEEAHHVQREWRYSGRDCIIRYIGPAGGGD